VSDYDAKRLQEAAILQRTQGVPNVQQVLTCCMCKAVLSGVAQQLVHDAPPIIDDNRSDTSPPSMHAVHRS
jgi:hypothetical protein